MINLIKIPQRAEFKAEYAVNDDMLTVKMNDTEEIFDFTGFLEGKAEEIIAEILPINPILSAEKIGSKIEIKVLRFYTFEEKELFEDGEN